jgi:signal transduction histidine kinase/CheY-like chemotaxis protein
VAAEGEAKHFEAYSEPLSRWYLASAFSDKPGYFGVMALDITERKRAEREVERARLDAEAANLAKSEFLANMSHEIRTPLNGALGMLQLLETTDLDKEQDEYVHIAMRSSRNLLTVINDILDLSCVEAGKLELRDETFDVAEAVRTAAAVFRGPAEEKGLDLDIRVSEDMPPALNGDSGRLRQILFNLIGNAIKFTISGTIRVETWPLYSANGKPLRLLFKVSDTGVGIPEHKQARIHEPFTQADGSYRRRFQGAGLGLSIVARLTKLMGGSLCFDSREGRGTDFYLRLDFSVEKQAGEDRSAAEGTLPVCENSRPVLLVEDDPVNRLTLRRMLDNMGYATHLAENGKQALAELEKQRFCCVLMDVQMPVMDGVSATRELRGAAMNHPNRDVPVVALTAHAMSGDREQFLSAGMTDYLAKPVNMKDLADALQRAIAEQRA